ncbi:MAG: Slp family lipoprotein [Candidatus Methylomirabilales bacterium]
MARGCALALILLTAACSVVPKAFREGTTGQPPFRHLAAGPEAYAGSRIVVGGEVAEVHAWGRGLAIEVIQRPLGFRDRPERERPSDGRFIALVQEPIAAKELYTGRRLTVVGVVRGAALRSSEEEPRRVPELLAQYLHLWPDLTIGGRRFGIGINLQGSIGIK